jgi:hypothetical protein
MFNSFSQYIQLIGPWLWGNRPFSLFGVAGGGGGGGGGGGAEEGAQWGNCPTTPPVHGIKKVPCFESKFSVSMIHCSVSNRFRT